ncbi:MAG: 6-phosphogluconolactonase [Sulfurovum sp.]|nr:6-phosphogluconolactonase [Sulfurovum sp.]MBT8348357.1 6-phosphogluconolactonase [Sulfurovum sp.]NNJ44920.1 6-phosphogluconolactonase [Sulfurovum sp.]
MSRIVHAFSKQESLIEALSQSILTDLQKAIDEKGKASLVVSGGSTPKPLFEKLRKAVFAWDKVFVGLCDERWVDVSQEESNENFVKKYLLQGEAAKANFIGMYEENTDIDTAQKACSKKIKEILSPFDVLILGMGSDAHTASLFPENVKLEEAFDYKNKNFCIGIEPTTAPFIRMSLTLTAILSAKHLYLHFEGEEKIAVYKKAIAGDDRYKMPIRSVLHQDIKNIEVFYR